MRPQQRGPEAKARECSRPDPTCWPCEVSAWKPPPTAVHMWRQSRPLHSEAAFASLCGVSPTAVQDGWAGLDETLSGGLAVVATHALGLRCPAGPRRGQAVLASAPPQPTRSVRLPLGYARGHAVWARATRHVLVGSGYDRMR